MKRLHLNKVPENYCEAPFWGNGSMGALLYTKENKLLFSLDHVCLWELRESLPDIPHATYREIVENPYGYLHDGQTYVEDTNIFHRAYGRTKLPGLTMYLELVEEIISFDCELNMDTGIGDIQLTLKGGQQLGVSVWLAAKKNVLVIKVTGGEADRIDGTARGWNQNLPALEPIRRWNYPLYEVKKASHGFAMSQDYSGDQTAVITGTMQKEKADTVWYVHLSTGSISKKEEIRKEAEILLKDFADNKEIQYNFHKEAYKQFWESFDINVPNERLQQAFYIEMYKIFCNERQDSMPITLQGVWNPDTLMPAWFGDLHNDLNVQSCYWAAFKTGNWKLAYPYIQYYSEAVPRFMERAQKLFGVEDAVHIPTMMAPNGYGAAAEWCFWNTLLGPELFVAVDFCWFFEYGQDRLVLKNKIIPFLKKVLNLYRGIAQADEEEMLHFPLTQSPEVFDSQGMLMKQDSTFTISSLRYIAQKLLGYMELVKELSDAEIYQTFLDRLPRVHTTEKGYPLFPDTELFESHRHLCQMFPVFPLSYDAHSQTANRTLDAVINQGFTEYAAFTFPYLSIMAARCGRGNMCRTMLENYCMAFRSPNSFTVNGDPYQNGLLKISETNAGESSWAFTLESGLIVPAALCEMFAHRAADTIYVAAGLPDEWEQCAARGVAVEGGHRISVKVEAYRVIEIIIDPGTSEEINLICFRQGKAGGKDSGRYEEKLSLKEGEPVILNLE